VTNGIPRWLVVTGVAVSAACAWLAVVPWDLSTVDAAGQAVEGDNRLAAVIVALLLGGLSVFLAVSLRRDAVLPAIAAAVLVPVVLYAWRASVANTDGASQWLASLVAFVLPLALLTSFGGAYLALRPEIAARRRRLRGDPPDGSPETDEGGDDRPA
jgi:hypothetical protein